MEFRSTRLPSRRSFLAGAGASGLLAALAACSNGGSSSAAGGTGRPVPAVGTFRYVDARGKHIDLAHVPTTVVAQSSAAASLWDAGYHVAGVYGELDRNNGKLNYQAGNIELGSITVIGSTYGQFNIEKYAAMNPGLLIDLSFDDKTLWYVPSNDTSQVNALAPSLGVAMPGKTMPAIIGEFMTVAAKLGADTGAASIHKAMTRFDSSLAAVAAAAKANPGLRVLVVSREVDDVYVADPEAAPDLALLAEHGMTFVPPSKPLEPSDYFQLVSWEKIGSFTADVIMHDAREAPDVAAAAAKIGTWRDLPAVKAGQVYPWYTAAPYSYASQAPLNEQVARWLTHARKVT